MRLRSWSLWTIALALLALAGCGPDMYTQQQAEEVRGLIEHRKEGVETARRDFAAFLASDSSAGFRAIAERESWEERINTGATRATEADEYYKREIQPLLDAQDGSLDFTLYEHADRIRAMLDESRGETELWRERLSELAEIQEKAELVRDNSRAGVGSVQDGFKNVEARAAAAMREFPEQASAIDILVAPLRTLASQSQASLAVLERQYEAHSSGGNADYGAFADAFSSIERAIEQAGKDVATAEAGISQLSRSYAKTLIDMRADYSLTVRRQSWDESAEYPSMTDFDFVREVEGPTFEHLEAIPGSLATFQKGWFSDTLSLGASVDQARWDELKIDPKENWPDGDAHSEFWVEKAEAKYFHKYHVVDNGEVTETDFVPVDEDLFFANLENLGMDVEVKPYGVFEKDKLTHAAPPGMAFVGNPRYGKWENQGGGQVWTWIAPYLFYRTLFGQPHVYPRNEWSSWRSGYYGSRPYYGSAGPSTPMYGTRSARTQTSPVLSGSRFSRSGGFGRPSGSVRGAGPSSRGGGFGGSGK